jgi:hypothetical protein
MIGLSLPKLLLFALLVAIVWFGYRYVNRVEQIRRAVREELRRRQPPGRPRSIEAEDLVKCNRCGAYVAARSASSCGRPDCPWGR